ncbi:uncharacterized protein LOC132746491 [Ruditapes philippinarum]|uniref:uncharacterized protein LOC132746491 n=1 Tax=Ruditapes philippinarum TaxID=129788 RepID=UPI00295ABA52|nr:uncharacterized protein LOC132746491 [Ruditapes philippinarum]XP_060591652.1 uncharacterized protein LOC132746491 [Ruditapes philippinarum]XP_060591653.1 uncharacterized protein LOC132746491 [Ruditapes philippinarum]
MSEPGPSTSTSGAIDHTSLKKDISSCKDFLQKCVTSCPASQRAKATSVVQELIDGKIEPEMLQAKLDVTVCEDHHLPLLKKTLPAIRHLLLYHEIKIKGITAPSVHVFKKHKFTCWSSELQGSRQVPAKTKQHENQVLKAMGKFLNNEEYSDIDVRVGKKVFKCHKIVLAASSSYFQALFSSGMSEVQDGMVELAALDEKEFKNILKVMYTGKCVLNKKNILDLLYSASYLQISFLEKDCIQFIENHMGEFSDTEHFELLKLSNDLDIHEISSRLLYWISCQFQNVRELEIFVQILTYKNLMELLDFPLNVSSEDDICNSLLNWIEFDEENRKQHGKTLISKLNYLALTEKYMKEVFLCHPVIQNDAGLQDVTSKCLEYIARPGRQWEYIGEDKSSHRVGHRYVDVMAVCYPTSILFTEFSRLFDGCDYSGQYTMIRESRNDKLKNLKRRPESIAACNLSRSEIVLSTGTQLFYFNGDTCTWSSGPMHSAPSTNNCLLYDPDLHSIYSVVVGKEKVLIEKCTSYSDSMEVLYSENARKEIVQNRTCAYLIGENIYMIKPYTTDASQKKHATIVRFNVITKSLENVQDTDLPFLCSVAVPHKDMVFIVDKEGVNILKVSNNGTLIEQHGKIGGYCHYDMWASRMGDDFGACIYNGRLILVRGKKTVSQHVLAFDLDAHVTREIPNIESKVDAAVSLKMTIYLDRG